MRRPDWLEEGRAHCPRSSAASGSRDARIASFVTPRRCLESATFPSRHQSVAALPHEGGFGPRCIGARLGDTARSRSDASGSRPVSRHVSIDQRCLEGKRAYRCVIVVQPFWAGYRSCAPASSTAKYDDADELGPTGMIDAGPPSPCHTEGDPSPLVHTIARSHSPCFRVPSHAPEPGSWTPGKP